MITETKSGSNQKPWSRFSFRTLLILWIPFNFAHGCLYQKRVFVFRNTSILLDPFHSLLNCSLYECEPSGHFCWRYSFQNLRKILTYDQCSMSKPHKEIVSTFEQKRDLFICIDFRYIGGFLLPIFNRGCSTCFISTQLLSFVRP